MKLLSLIYRFIISLRNSCYDKGIFRQVKTATPVISIGNLTVGGTGKTPFTITLADFLKSRKLKIAVVGRGYKRSATHDINSLDSPEEITPEKIGDEMYLIASKCDVPVFVGSKKYRSCIEADKRGFDLILIDDGFQHRKIKRDLDILMLDERTLTETALLPAGRLREPLRNIRRADALVLRDLAPGVLQKTLVIPDDFIILKAGSKIDVFFHLYRQGETKSPAELCGSRIALMTGIELPEKFYRLIEENITDIDVTEKFAFADHHVYSAGDVKKVTDTCQRSGTSIILTTEKDAVKLARFSEHFRNKGIDVFISGFTLEIEGFNSLWERISEVIS